MPAGMVAVMDVELTTTTLVAALAATTLPTVTAVAPVNTVPVIVTAVPPTSGPLAGLMEVTVGTGA